MREKRRSPLESQRAGLSPDYLLAQIESAGHALDFNSDLLNFDLFTSDTLRNRLIAQFDGGSAFARLRTFCKSAATDFRELVDSHGPHAIVSNLLTLALARRYSPDALAELSRESLDQWIRLLSVACAARRIAALRGCPTEVMHRAYAGAMLHEIGVFVLMADFPRAYRRVLDRSRVAQQSIAASEIELLGADHHVIGRRTLLRWSMPAWIVDAAWLHAHPIESVSADRDIELIAHIQLAAKYVNGRRDRDSAIVSPPSDSAPLLARLGVDASAVTVALDGLDREVADLVARLQLDPTSGNCEPAKLRRENLDLEASLADATQRAAELEETTDALARCIHFLHGAKVFDLGEALRACVSLLDDAASVTPFAIVVVQPDSEFIRYAWSGQPNEVYVVRFTPEGRSALSTSSPRRLHREALPAAVSDALSELPAELASSDNALPLGFPTLGYVLSAASTDLRLYRSSIVAKCAAVLLRQAVERESLQRDIERVVLEARGALPGDPLAARIPEIIAELASGAAHELNNPLSVISGRAQMLKTEITRPDLQHALEQIEAKAGECSQIIRELMEFARPPAPSPAIVGIGELIEEALAAWSRSARLSSAWTRNLGCTDPDSRSHRIEVDRKQMQSALIELLQNAEIAIRDNEGLIDIAWRRDPHDRRHVIIEVRDTGKGMTPEVARRAFDPFYSHRPAGRGRGLGLARAQRSVTAAGGTLTLESAPGIGTTARIRLPLHQAAE